MQMDEHLRKRKESLDLVRVEKEMLKTEIKRQETEQWVNYNKYS